MSLQHPAGDDAGPAATCVYPPDLSLIGEEGDCLKVEARAAGRSLTLAMAAVRNGFASTDFDPAPFNILCDAPDEGGTAVLPETDAQAPAGCLWDCQQRVCSFDQGLHSQENAAADCRGETLTGSPQTNVDPAAGTIAFACEADDFGRTEWSGVKICPAARDIDGRMTCIGR